jgi:glycine/D-amino acid oxidase-like deaminating enzyme
MGASAAYHAKLYDPSLSICVVERDPKFEHASAMLSAGGIRQQFSLPANIQLSLYGIDFLRHAASELRVPGEDAPDMQLKEQGYLFLASAAGEPTLRRNQATQAAEGVTWTTLLEPRELVERFPWLNADGVALGCFGEHSEGWFDPWGLLGALRAKGKQMGITYLHGTVVGLECEATWDPSRPEPMRRVSAVRVAEGSKSTVTPGYGMDTTTVDTVTIGSGTVVNAAGSFARGIVEMCGSGVASLPVRARKRSIFSVQCGDGSGGGVPPSRATPLVIDPSGVWFRPEGPSGRFICGVSPPEARDPDCTSVEELSTPDHDLFDETVWPALYGRCEAFGELKVQSSWAGFYEYNTLDQNAIIGRHPQVPNLVLCNGFSGAPASP